MASKAAAAKASAKKATKAAPKKVAKATKAAPQTVAKTSVRRSHPAGLIRMCIPKVLSNSQRAARDAGFAKLMSTLGPMPAVEPKSSVWPNGTTLRVRFVGGDPQVQGRIQAFALEWLRYANINLVFGNDRNAEIRVAFDTSDGSWSYVGKDNLGIPKSQATMNYGWLTPTTSEWEYRRVVLHEFGHAVGLAHEHQSPAQGIPWDKAACYAYYKQTQGWSKAEVDTQVLNPMKASQTNYTSWDRDSIMEYPIDDQLTIGTFSVDWNQELSAVDREFIGRGYARNPICIGVANTAIVARESGHLDLFWIAPDGRLMSVWWHEGQQWSAPFQIAGPGSAKPGAITAIARASNHLDVFWVGPDGSVRSTWWHEGQQWAAPFDLAGPGSAEAGSISVVARESGHLDLFWISPAGQITSVWWHEGQNWSAPFTLSGQFTAKPGVVQAVARMNNHLDVFWVSQGGEVSSVWWHEGQNWSAPFMLSAKESAEPGSVFAIARMSDHLDVFWVSPEGEIRSTWWHEGQTWASPFVIAPEKSAMCPGAVVATARLTDHLDVYWVGPDGSVRSTWWHENQPWAAPFVLAGGNVACERSIDAVARLSNHLDVFIVGPDGSVRSSWWHDGQPWSAPFNVAGAGAAAL